MFLFEGEFGNILHTGDCRLSSDCLKKLPLKYMTMKGSETCLDCLFLDCTFGRCSITIPSKESAIRQVSVSSSDFFVFPVDICHQLLI